MGPPYRAKSMIIFLAAVKLATLHAYVCALLSELIRESSNLVPTVLWYGGLCLIASVCAFFVYHSFLTEMYKDETNKYDEDTRKLLERSRREPSGGMKIIGG